MLSRPNLYPTVCVVQYIKEKGVDFFSTPDNREWLELFNAPQELIEVIQPPPPPAKPSVAGPLTIQCEASEGHECEIIANGRYYGSTGAGQRTIPDLQAGEAKVRVWSEGLGAQEKTVSLSADTPASVKFSLQRSLLTRRESTRDLLSGIVLKRFGGAQGLGQMDYLAANQEGAATIADGVSGRQEWTMSVIQQQWGAITVKFQNKVATKDSCTTIKVSEDGSTSATDCNSKPKPKTASPQLTKAASLFGKYQLHVQLARLLTRRLVDVAGSERNEITTDDGPDSYVLSLDPTGLPSAIVHRTAEDAAPIKAEYADYIEVKGHSFPRKITIWEGTTEKPVAEFSLTSIGPPATPPTNNKKKPAK